MTIMIPVKNSSNVREFGYHEETATLIIGFKGSASYTYDGVPPETYAELKRVNEAGESVGKFISAEIKSKYQGTRVPAPPFHAGPNSELAAG